MNVTTERAVRKTFKNKEGKWALGAAPNLPLYTWFVMLLLAQITTGTWQTVFVAIGHGAIFTWAWLELFQGVNYFRRILGAVVLFAAIWTAVHH